MLVVTELFNIAVNDFDAKKSACYKSVFVVTELFNIAVNDFDAKKSARHKWVLVVTELFNIAVNDFDTKKSACCSRVLVVTELVVSGTQCIFSLRKGRAHSMLSKSLHKRLIHPAKLCIIGFDNRARRSQI